MGCDRHFANLRLEIYFKNTINDCYINSRRQVALQDEDAPPSFEVACRLNSASRMIQA